MDVVAERFIIQQESVAPQAAVSEDTMGKIAAVSNFISLFQVLNIGCKLNGRYNVVPAPQLGIDGIETFPFDFEITGCALANGGLNGSGGTLEIDVKWQPYDNSAGYVSIFSTTPKFTPASAQWDDIFDGDTKTGFVAPVLSKTEFNAKDKLRFDLLQVPTGLVDFAGIKLFWRPR